MCFPLLTGCVGVYAEVAATTYPSASLGSASTSASSVGFNVGADFGNTSKRFALGYESQSISVDKGGSASLGASSARLDFNVLSLSDRAKVRLGGAFEFASGSSKLAGMTKKDASGGGAYAGVGFTYFPTWHVGLHALAGAAYSGAQLPGADLSGAGATFRLAVTYQFIDLRPSPDHFYPLERNTDITGLIDDGAHALGCATRHQSHASEGYAYVDVECSGRSAEFFQIDRGMMLHCDHMFDDECEGFGNQILESSKNQVKGDSTRQAVVDEPASGIARMSRACDLGDSNGCTAMGTAYLLGEGVAKDGAAAVKFFERGCDASSSLACKALAQLYANGLPDVAKDPDRATKLMKKACDLHDDDACKAVTEPPPSQQPPSQDCRDCSP